MAKAPTPGATPAPILLICGNDDYTVKQRGGALYTQWTAEIGGMDHEVIDANVANASEAVKALARLRESVNTLPFFGSGKVVWFKNCNFLGDDRTASSSVVSEDLGDLAQDFKAFDWTGVRLLITAGKVDKRKVFYKAIDKMGRTEVYEQLSVDTRDWVDQAEVIVWKALAAQGKKASDEALGELVARVGPNTRQLHSEVEKVCLYVGDRAQVDVQDVMEVCVRNKNARAFALGDALGERKLPLVLRRLDEELWETKLDRSRSSIGLLYGLIFKVRAMLLAQEMLREGWIKPGRDTASLKAQLSAIPPESVPSDSRFNPAALNPFVLMKAIPHAQNYTQAELVQAMDLLLQCNLQLVTTSLDEAMVLQQALIKIAGGVAPFVARSGA